MRHKNHRGALNKVTSHRKADIANIVKSLIIHGRLILPITHAKAAVSTAERVITWAKKGGLSSTRRIVSVLRLTYNKFTSKEARKVKDGQGDAILNTDRKVLGCLKEYAELFKNRVGGYTRVVKYYNQKGDGRPMGVMEYLDSSEKTVNDQVAAT